MAIDSGPGIVESDLQFYYDMNNLQKSFKGRPTTNTCSFGTFEYGYNSTKISNATPPVPPPVTGYPIYKITSNDGGDSQQILYTASVDQVNGGTYTHSVYVYLESGTWVSAGQHWNPWDYGTQQFIPAGVWTRIEDPVTNSGSNYGNVALCYNTNGAVYVTGTQYELGSFASPLVTGTRSTSQAIVDLTGNNTVTATSLTYASDVAFSFNGSNNYLTISNFTTKPTTVITCEAWIKPTKPILTGTIRGAAISATNSMYLGIIDSIDGGVTHALHWANQTSASRVNSWNGNVPNNAWSHITGTYDGTTMKAYINGVEVYSAAQTGTIPDATYVIGTYGGALQDGVHNFNGLIPVSKIYNRALSAAEVQQNFNATRSRYGI